VGDFMPISLVHNFSKIVTKLLANRLALELKNLVSSNQTSFIKNRCIHDSFALVQGTVKHLHKKHILALFIKLGISKAFNMVN
jgi:hypothetical protein